jgi:hypothetical protein
MIFLQRVHPPDKAYMERMSLSVGVPARRLVFVYTAAEGLCEYLVSSPTRLIWHLNPEPLVEGWYFHPLGNGRGCHHDLSSIVLVQWLLWWNRIRCT